MTETTGRCIDHTCTDGPTEPHAGPRPRWVNAPSLLCARCANNLERRLAELPSRQQQLRAVLGGLRSGGDSENKRTKGSPPIPLNVSAHDLLEQMHATVVSWTMLVREERGLRGPDRADVPHLAPWLLGQLDWLVEQPWADDLADEMRDLSRTADGLTRVRAGWHRKPLPCDQCAAQELGRWDGTEGITCGSCGAIYSDDAYLGMVARRARDSDALLDRAATAHLLGVSRGYLRVMIARRELSTAGVIDGRPYYLAAEVQALRDTRQSAAS